jgi:hypothetical protein
MRRSAAALAVALLWTPACATTSLSSTEGRIAFQRFFKGESRIVSVRADGTGVAVISHSTARSENPEFSPDGRFIAFERSFSIYVAHFDGSDRRLIARDGYDPTWSPDGKHLLFIRSRGDTHAGILSVTKTAHRRIN